MAHNQTNYNVSTLEEQGYSHQQLESTQDEADDEHENRNVIDKNKTNMIKMEIKQEELDIPCDNIYSCHEKSDNVFEEVSVLHYNPPVKVEHLKDLKNEPQVESSQDPLMMETSDQNSVERKNTDAPSSRFRNTLLQDREFKCDLCPRQFVYKHGLTHHKRLHSGEGVWVCEHCAKRFLSASELKRHTRTHTGEKPYKCPTCQKGFSQDSHLQTHKRTHTGEKPCTCEICNYRCALPSDLRRHMRIHTGEKPYACDICDYKSTLLGVLNRHKRTHTGEKPYACDNCDYKCAVLSVLNRHKRTHTGEKPHACDICDYRCARSSHLIRHKRTHTT